MNTLAISPLTRFELAPQRAILRLRAGASPWPWWKFSESDCGLQIVLGSDPNCDWQIASAGVEEQELEVFFTGRALLVRSMRPGRGARLNGVKLGAGWTPLEDGARLEMGLASIEVSMFPCPVAEQPSPEARPTLQQPDWPTLESSVRGRAAQVDDWERARHAEAEAAATQAPTTTDVWQFEQPAERVEGPDPRVGAHLFEDPLASQQPVLVRYLAYSAALGVAYALWVMVLDRL